MRRSAPHFLLAAALLLSLTAAADQNDQRLAPLFETLKTTGDLATARAAEVEIWRIWIDSGDGDIDALMVEGVVAMNNARFADAITIFGEITARAPAFAEGWNKRATAYFLNENYAASVRDIQTTLALEPRHFGAISGMGLIFLTRGDETGALAAFEAVVAIHPKSPGARQRIEELRKRVLERGA
ncbi:MAG: tetratricopeptide repeat protein [Gammaproteobacteria bacterium]|nr:tetratricopeptide repeat protein [Gammaproteobacteria bacterium]MDX2460130.1 tetratricopeptide repeat protein [Gammaproteobacteria bacterium]